jgi:hypothetical protein
MKPAKLSTFLIGSLILLAALSPALILADPAMTPTIHIEHSTSSNWSGYAATAATGLVTDVKGSWRVPTVSSGSTNAWSSFWVGIDGYSSNTVEQIGTDSDWQNGKAVYYAWYEFYPKPAFLIKSVPINPGDVISAEAQYTRNKFTVTITDTTTGKAFSTTAKVQSAQRTSAEWIAEAPWSGGVLPLANFGTVYFSGCYATINGATGSISSFSHDAITMTTSSGIIKAQPSTLDSTGTSFSVTWKSAGP